MHDELASMFGGMARYAGKGSNAGEPGAAFWKSAFNGSPHVENRKGVNGEGKYLRLESPLVSVTGGIQPEAMRRVVTRQYLEDGLASRFLWAWPPDRPAGWVDDEPGDEGSADSYARAYTRLSEIPLNVNPDGSLRPFFLGLRRDAQDAAKAWVNGWAKRTGDESNPALRAAVAKMKGVAFRLALLFHLTDWGASGSEAEAGPIEADTLARAIAVVEWFANEAERVYGLLAESETDSAARQLTEWCERQPGPVSASELSKRHRDFKGKPEEAEKALMGLVEAGFGDWVNAPSGPQGGRTTRRYQPKKPSLKTNTPSNPEDSEGFGSVSHQGGAESASEGGW